MSFGDTFTGNSEQEDLLNYDDSAAYYFVATVLLVIVLPWTWRLISNALFGEKIIDFPAKTKAGTKIRYCHNDPMMKLQARIEKEHERQRQLKTRTLMLWNVLLVFLWVLLFYCSYRIVTDESVSAVNIFNPFEILQVEHGASDKDIKKAYRKMSLEYHPDKNLDDPLANAKFIQISKAYNSLTDETAKSNYEKYGNPDGPTTSKVGIGLPRFLLEKKNHMTILIFFFFILLVVVPAIFILYWQQQKNYAPNGVLMETLQFMGFHINDKTTVKEAVELLAASAESRELDIALESDETEEAMKKLYEEVQEHAKRKFDVEMVVRNKALIGAHMQRHHHMMTEELRIALDKILLSSMKVTNSMVELSCMREWFGTAMQMIEFKRMLFQAVDMKDTKSKEILQVPHFTVEEAKHCVQAKKPCTSIVDFCTREADQRKGTVNFSPEQLMDITEFSKHLPRLLMKIRTYVEGEEIIAKEDVLTIEVNLLRENIEEGEAAGPIHAPFFPEIVNEEWYLFLTDGPGPNARLFTHEKINSQEREMSKNLRIHLGKSGKHSFYVHLMSANYLGLDQKQEVAFNVLTEEEAQRQIYVHPEDQDLDLHPTLIQQVMGDLHGEDPESEDEEDSPVTNGKSPEKKAAKESSSDSSSDDSSGSDSDSD